MVDRRTVLGGAMLAPVAGGKAMAGKAMAGRALAGRALAGSAAPGVEALLGAWRLIEARTIYPDGHSGDWNGRAIAREGLICYLPNGWMSVQITRPRPALDHAVSFPALPPEQRLALMDPYYGYYGRFEVLPEVQEVHHHLTGSLDPSEIGLVYRRRYAFEGDQLVLTTINNKNSAPGAHNRLSWRRA